MCRSILEHPPAGLRCDRRDHLPPDAREAKRLARNAREKQLYYIRKERKAAEAGKTAVPATFASTPDPAEHEEPTRLLPTQSVNVTDPREIQGAREYLSVVSKDENRLSDHATEDFVSTAGDRERLAALLVEDQGLLAYLPVIDDDENFALANDSANQVQKLTLADGTVGYFKSYEGAADYDDGGTAGEYGKSHLETSLNEVAAYRLAQAMGGEYAKLVPETVMRAHNGMLGTFQKEAKGSVGYYGLRVLKSKNAEGKLDMAAWRRAAVYEYVVGAQDRHAGNYIVDNREEPSSPVLIDNGFTFRRGEQFVGIMNISSFVTKSSGQPTSLNDDEMAMLIRLRDSEELENLKKVISPESHQAVIERIDKMLEEGQILDAEDEGYDEPAGW